MNALNTVLGCCVVSSTAIYLLDINLDALIVYANGIFIMIYLLCMLAGCRLLKGRFKALAAVGCVLCLMLLAMVGWKSVYAIVMLAGLWVFYRSGKLRRPGERAPPGQKLTDRLYDLTGRAAHPYAGIPFKGIPGPVLKPPRHTAETQMRQQLHGQVLLHRRQQQQQAEEVCKEARQDQQQTSNNQRHAFDHLGGRAFACGHLLLH